MSEAAQEIAPESAEEEYVPGVDPDPEMPDFDLFGGDVEESVVTTEEATEEAKEEKPKPDDGWSARVKKDRSQRKREIELKKREQELSQKERLVSNDQQLRDSFMSNPEKFLESQGVDPMEFFADWTNRISTGINSPDENTRLSSTERQVKELKQELIRRDQERLQNATAAQQQDAINGYYSQIDGLGEKETNIFNDPAIIAKFKKYHGLDASNNRGRRSHLTLSNNLETQPTKTPAEDMTDDEIHEFWKGKLFT
jgi:hypothetical protein